jgi:hypothetical protein
VSSPTPKAFPRYAIYGFTTMLMKLLREQQRLDYIAVTFDVKGPHLPRHDTFGDYKARPGGLRPMPDPADPPRQGGGAGWFGGSRSWSSRGSRRTTFFGTLAVRYGGTEMEVVIVSGDRT